MGDVGRVFMFGFEESVINSERLTFFKSIGAKNFILFKRNIEHLEENVSILKNEFDNPIIAVDCEGGNVRRFKETEDFMFSNMNIGSSFNPSYAEEVYFRCGEILHKNGINLNLAPVVDFYLAKGNVIGIRSFGSFKDNVANMSKKAIEGLHRANVYSCVKHFIGYGKALNDPHLVLPKTELTLDELELSLYSFKSVSSITDFVMTAHIIVPIIDELPITYCRKGLSILREFFKGPVLTDDLEMDGAKVFPLYEIPLKALESGNDMLAVCSNFEIQKEMVHSVDHNHLDLDPHIERIESIPKFENFEPIEVGEKYYITLLKDNNFIGKSDFKFFKFALFSEVKVEEGSEIKGNFSLDPNESEIEEIVSSISSEDNVAIAIYNAFRHPAQKVLLSKIIQKAKSVCLIIAGDPADRELFNQVDCILLTHSPLPQILSKVIDVIEGKLEPSGRMPL